MVRVYVKIPSWSCTFDKSRGLLDSIIKTKFPKECVEIITASRDESKQFLLAYALSNNYKLINLSSRLDKYSILDNAKYFSQSTDLGVIYTSGTYYGDSVTANEFSKLNKPCIVYNGH